MPRIIVVKVVASPNYRSFLRLCKCPNTSILNMDQLSLITNMDNGLIPIGNGMDHMLNRRKNKRLRKRFNKHHHLQRRFLSQRFQSQRKSNSVARKISRRSQNQSYQKFKLRQLFVRRKLALWEFKHPRKKFQPRL